MTLQELRKTSGYIEAMEKIKKYNKGFKFTINWLVIPKAKANALNIVLRDAMKSGLLDNISTGINLDGDITEEEFIKL